MAMENQLYFVQLCTGSKVTYCRSYRRAKGNFNTLNITLVACSTCQKPYRVRRVRHGVLRRSLNSGFLVPCPKAAVLRA